MAPSGPVNIIYIMGMGHSGSTLLDLVLGSHSQIESVGEIRCVVKSRMEIEPGVTCPCGAPAADCAYWNDVKACMGGPLSGEDMALDSYRLFQSILAVTGKSWICDSSKQVGWLKVYLSRPDLFTVRIIHLVRDPRAVGYSMHRKWGRETAKHGGARNARERLRQRGRSIFTYNYYHLIIRSLSIHRRAFFFLHRRTDCLRVRYEDFVRHPREALPRLMTALGFEVEEQQYNFSDRTHHNLNGNTMRRRKKQDIREDTEYLDKGAITPFMWWVGTGLTWPFLLLYRYPLSRARARAAAISG